MEHRATNCLPLLFLLIALAGAFVACSSQGGGVNPSIGGPSLGRHHVLRSRFAVAGNTAQIGGQIDAVGNDAINIKNTSCTGGGLDDIDYNQGGVTTQFDPSGSQPTNGQYLRATGVMRTPLPCNVITSAAYVTLSAAPVPTVSAKGTITAVNPDGYSFTLTNGSTTNTVVLNSYTNPTASPAVDDVATVSGYGIPGSGHFIHVTSVSFVTPTPGPTHVFSWDYGEMPGPTTYPSPDLPYISMVQDSVTEYSAFYQSHSIKVEDYPDQGAVFVVASPPAPIFIADGGKAGQQAQPSPDFLHDCNGNVVTNGNAYWDVQDFSKSAVIANMQKYAIGSNFSTYFNYLFVDGASHEYELSATPCTGKTPISDSSFMNTLISGYGQLGPPVLVNGLDDKSLAPMPCACLTVAEAVAGARQEQTYICPGAGEGGCANQQVSPTPGAGYEDAVTHPYWQASENTEIDMANAGKLLLLEEYDNRVDPASATGMQHRMFGYASFLLTYSLANTGIFYGAQGFGEGSADPILGGARLYPEVEVVALHPSSSVANNGITSLESSGVYIRYYNNCYLKGARVGACLVAVNPDENSSHPFPTVYANVGPSCSACHTLVLHNGSGGHAEIQNGGYVTVDGPKPSASMGPDTAAIVFDVSQ